MNGLEALTIVFVVLKLTDVIDWSWWAVLAPTWLPLLAVGLYIYTQNMRRRLKCNK